MMGKVKCPDRQKFTKAQISAAMYEARGGMTSKYPAQNQNHEGLFNYVTGTDSLLLEYPLMDDGSTWKKFHALYRK
jgi:hypothetical protein